MCSTWLLGMSTRIGPTCAHLFWRHLGCRFGGRSVRVEGCAVVGRVAVVLPGAGAGDAEQVGDLGPGVVLVAGVGDCSGESLLGFGDEAGEEVEGGAGVAEPWQSAEGAEGVDGLFEDTLAVGAGGRCEVVVAARLSHSA